VCCLLALAPAAWANTYTPNKTSDPKPDGCKRSDCSLREAIIAANHHPGADAVILHSGKAYKLSIGPLKVTDAATIRASGSKAATVDGGRARFWRVREQSFARLARPYWTGDQGR
jgi:CSLREA domain-containing protein